MLIKLRFMRETIFSIILYLALAVFSQTNNALPWFVLVTIVNHGCQFTGARSLTIMSLLIFFSLHQLSAKEKLLINNSAEVLWNLTHFGFELLSTSFLHKLARELKLESMSI